MQINGKHLLLRWVVFCAPVFLLQDGNISWDTISIHFEVPPGSPAPKPSRLEPRGRCGNVCGRAAWRGRWPRFRREFFFHGFPTQKEDAKSQQFFCFNLFDPFLKRWFTCKKYREQMKLLKKNGFPVWVLINFNDPNTSRADPPGWRVWSCRTLLVSMAKWGTIFVYHSFQAKWVDHGYVLCYVKSLVGGVGSYLYLPFYSSLTRIGFWTPHRTFHKWRKWKDEDSPNKLFGDCNQDLPYSIPCACDCLAVPWIKRAHGWVWSKTAAPAWQFGRLWTKPRRWWAPAPMGSASRWNLCADQVHSLCVPHFLHEPSFCGSIQAERPHRFVFSKMQAFGGGNRQTRTVLCHTPLAQHRSWWTTCLAQWPSVHDVFCFEQLEVPQWIHWNCIKKRDC